MGKEQVERVVESGLRRLHIVTSAQSEESGSSAGKLHGSSEARQRTSMCGRDDWIVPVRMVCRPMALAIGYGGMEELIRTTCHHLKKRGH